MSGRAAPRLLPLALALSLTSCATTGTGAISPQAIEQVCSAWPYVRWSTRDTAGTISDAKANNAARTAFCPATDRSPGLP
jgi:hypothetical protein